MIKYLKKIAIKMEKNVYILSIRDGFMTIMPLLIIGSFFMLILNLPINGWKNIITSNGIDEIILKPMKVTYNIISILCVLSVTHSFAKYKKTDTIICDILSIICLFLVMPLSISRILESGESISIDGISFQWLGSNGIFSGVIISFIVTNMYYFILNKEKKTNLWNNLPNNIRHSFENILPSLIIVITFLMINFIFSMTKYGNLYEFIFMMLQKPLTILGGNLHAYIIAFICLHLFWFFGINGSAIVGSILNPILQTLSLENATAYKLGKIMPNIISSQFKNFFSTFGGCGSTLSLILAMIFFCRSKRIKKIAKISIIPAIFGINEPILFGLPIILNPIMLIPFVVVPLINIIITYALMSVNLVPFCNGLQIPWNTPIILSGLLVTNWTGAILQIVLLIFGIILYLPFVKKLDYKYLEEENKLT